ncbi:MAG: alpha/beta hydrolase [Oscillospiraceae bacterium]
MTLTRQKKKHKHLAVKITVIALAVVILLFAVLTIVVAVLMNMKFGRGDYISQQLSANYYYPKYESDYPRVNVSFKSGENTLQGYIYGADNDKALLVFAHGINSGHEVYMKSLLWFVDNGWRVFTYDATGSGHSEGAGTMGLPQSAVDLDAALDYIEADPELSVLPRFLMGHSWGGYAVTAVLNLGHEVDGVASVSGYAEPIEMIYEFAGQMIGGARVLAYPSMWLYNKLLFGEYAGLSAVDGINCTDTPVLIIHGTEDEVIGYEESAIMHKRDLITNPSVEYLTLEGCNHKDMFDTPEGIVIKQEIKETISGMKQEREPSESEIAAVYQSADLDAANQPNAEFLSQIESFFEEILE